jgi:polysaccharide biosynthesis protein PslH
MRLLFIKRRLVYPRSSGHDVHTWELMRALAALGHEIAFGSLDPTRPDALHGLNLVEARNLLRDDDVQSPIDLSPLQERFRRYWGIDRRAIAACGRFAEEFGADAVIVSGLEILPCIGNVRQAVRVWYASDEWVRHHLSLVQLRSPASWMHLKQAVLKGTYEWAFADRVDRVWVVTENERRAIGKVMSKPSVDVVPNGVDIAHFAPVGAPERPSSVCFWGRLDFEPNVDALTWFCREVWPPLRRLEPAASLTVYGFRPQTAVVRLCETTPGVRLVPDLPDLRREIESHAVVVLPFVSGGGIKNKLLEAAALARPVVATPRACEGVQAEAPVRRVTRPDEWVAAILELWGADDRRREVGRAMRAWVARRHSWTAAAERAAAGIEDSGKRNERQQ